MVLPCRIGPPRRRLLFVLFATIDPLFVLPPTTEQDVLRIIPVKDDRVLPEELVKNLLNTGVDDGVNQISCLPTEIHHFD